MLKLKKLKAFALAAGILALTLAPSSQVYAVEVSEEILEVPQDENTHTVIAFGKSIAIIHTDNQIEIIANNLSGRIDVMIDGQVTKNIGRIIIPAQNKTNMALEEGSFIVNGMTEEQANALKKMAADSLSKDMYIENTASIENIGQQPVSVFIMGPKGELQASDGNKAPVNSLAGTQVTTPDALYETFANEMDEIIRQEQEILQKEKEKEQAQKKEESVSVELGKEENNDNTVTNGCSHEWEVSSAKSVIIRSSESSCEGCATPPIYQCAKCEKLMWLSKNFHEHGEEYCQYCGYNIHGDQKVHDTCLDGSEHEYSETEYGINGVAPIINFNYSSCLTGKIRICTKCNTIDSTTGTIHEHGDDYCTYCGYNKNGELKPTE